MITDVSLDANINSDVNFLNSSDTCAAWFKKSDCKKCFYQDK